MSNRRAPVQAESCGHLPLYCKRHAPNYRGHKPGTIAWSEHEKAYEDYARQYGYGQSAERLAERGGFGFWEITQYLGHEPTTWEPA